MDAQNSLKAYVCALRIDRISRVNILNSTAASILTTTTQREDKQKTRALGRFAFQLNVYYCALRLVYASDMLSVRPPVNCNTTL